MAIEHDLSPLAMSLLTPNENTAFQSFLTSIDCSQEWNMYQSPHQEPVHEEHKREALARATKDLMALDGDRWQQQHYDYSHQQPSQYHSEMFPFLNTQLPPLNTHTAPRSAASTPPVSAISTSSTYSTHIPSPSSPYDLTPASSMRSSPGISMYQKQTPTQPSGSYFSPNHTQPMLPMLPPSLKRHRIPSPEQSLPYPIQRSRSHPTSQPIMPYPRHSVLPPQSAPSHSHYLPHHTPTPPIHPPITPLPNPTSSTKPTLLSPSQKKANHIQSEQKRRANIRRGYEALCDTVPALREAIRREEEGILAQQAAVQDGTARRPRRPRGARTVSDGEKMDGRAGPRSENVVLSKTIDYVNELLSERSALLSRLQNARSALPQGHPALVPLCLSNSSNPQIPLWEREWKGGEDPDDDDDELNSGANTSTSGSGLRAVSMDAESHAGSVDGDADSVDSADDQV